MRKSRYQSGSVKKQRGRWIGMWYEADGGRKSKSLGLVKDISKSDARTAVNRIVAEVKAKRNQNRIWKFGEFVTEVYFPYYSRKWKHSTRENNVNRVSVHLVASFGDRELSNIKRDGLSALGALLIDVDDIEHIVVDRHVWDGAQGEFVSAGESHYRHGEAGWG